MCRIAFEGDRVEVSDIEIGRGGKSYTVDTLEELRKTYPPYFSSKNKIELSDKNMIDKILNTIKEAYSNERVTDIDGVKVDFDAKREWVHLRKSNTEPIIRIYAEAPTQAEADALAQEIIAQINTIIG